MTASATMACEGRPQPCVRLALTAMTAVLATTTCVGKTRNVQVALGARLAAAWNQAIRYAKTPASTGKTIVELNGPAMARATMVVLERAIASARSVPIALTADPAAEVLPLVFVTTIVLPDRHVFANSAVVIRIRVMGWCALMLGGALAVSVIRNRQRWLNA